MVPETYDFTEPDTSSQNLDILFIIHATGSFNGQLSQGVASGLSSFVAALGNINYQIGVMLGYPGGTQSGTLWNSSKNSGGPVLSSSSMTLAQIETALENDIAYAPTANINVVDPAGQTISSVHGEFGTLSLMNAFTATNYAASQKAGFFRSNAALAVVFAANEADNCFIGADDDDALEATWKNDFCAAVTAQGVVNAVKGAQGTNPYLFGFIGYETYPLTSAGAKIDEEEAGDGYVDVTNLTGGVTANLDPGNTVATSTQQATIIQNGLAGIGNLAKSKLNLTTTFMLQPNAVASSIMVYINGTFQAATQWTFDPATDSVTIPGVASKDMVEIRYYVTQ
jgi:hypothetical protein